MTREEFFANRKAAGQAIDVETCRVWWEHCNIADPYGVGPDPCGCIGRVTFVASFATGGKVADDDLPEDKYRALVARIERGRQTPRTPEGVADVLVEEYNRAVAELDEGIYDLVGRRFAGVPLDVIRSGVHLTLAKLDKDGTPLQEALDRRFGWLEAKDGNVSARKD